MKVPFIEDIITLSQVENSNTVLYYVIPVFVVTFLLEVCFILFVQGKEMNVKDSIASISLGLGSAVLNTFIKAFFFFIFTLIYQYRLFEFNNSAWWALILLVLGDDFSFYWAHRSSHEIRILWAAHENHHSSAYFNFAVAVRQSWTEYFYKYIFWLWMPLIGFNPLYIMWAIAINLAYQFFVHTELVNKLGFLEYFMNTPSHHRVHHGSNFIYLDKNHAGMFIIWDRIFGTFQAELDEIPVNYGITTPLQTYNPIRIVANGYIDLWKSIRSAPRLQDKLKYLIKPPGWSHDKSTLTVREMKKRGLTDFEDLKSTLQKAED